MAVSTLLDELNRLQAEQRRSPSRPYGGHLWQRVCGERIYACPQCGLSCRQPGIIEVSCEEARKRQQAVGSRASRGLP